MTNNERRLRHAARQGSLWEVRTIVEEPDTALVAVAGALEQAAGNGRLDVVRFLVSRCDAKANNSAALRAAVQAGHDEVVDTLLPFSEPRAAGSRILREAAFLGDLRMVRQLLPFCDPNARHSAALQDAAVCGEAEIVELLLPVSDAGAAWRELERKFRKAIGSSKRELAIGLETLCASATEKDLKDFQQRHSVDLEPMPRTRERLAAMALKGSLESTLRAGATERRSRGRF